MSRPLIQRICAEWPSIARQLLYSSILTNDEWAELVEELQPTDTLASQIIELARSRSDKCCKLAALRKAEQIAQDYRKKDPAWTMFLDALRALKHDNDVSEEARKMLEQYA